MQNEERFEISDLPFPDRFVAAYKMYASGVNDISSFFAGDGTEISNKSIASIITDNFAAALHSFSIKSIMLGGYQGLTQEEAVIISDFFDENSFAAAKNDDVLTVLTKILEAAPLEKRAKQCFEENSLDITFDRDLMDNPFDHILKPHDGIGNDDLNEIIECSDREHSIIKENYHQMLMSCGDSFSRPKIFNIARNFLASVQAHFDHEERIIGKFDKANFEKHCDEHINITLSITVLVDQIQVSIVSEDLFVKKVKDIEDRIMAHASGMDAFLMDAIFINSSQEPN